MQPKILITGATGFIGSHLVKYFEELEFKVRATDLPQADFNKLKLKDTSSVEIIPSDILDINSLRKAVQDIDIIVHTAAIFDYSVPYPVMYKVNVEGVKNICEVAVEDKVKRFIMFSTIGVYGEPIRTPCPEDGPKHPRNNYEITKWEGEKLAFRFYKEKGLPVTAIRPALVYGPGSKYGDILYLCLLSAVAAKGRKKTYFCVKGGRLSQRVHIEDVCQAVYLLTTKPEEEVKGIVFNIAGDEAITLEELFLALMQPFNLKVIFKIPFSLFIIVVRIMRKCMPDIFYKIFNKLLKYWWQKIIKKFNLLPELTPRMDRSWFDYLTADYVFDTTRIKNLGLKLRHPKFTESIKETIEWYKKNRWLP